MSVETMSLVLNHSTAKGTAKVVLIGIANHDGDGGAWPSIATLARYANTSERSVQRAIEQLVDAGELKVQANAGGTSTTRPGYRPNRYVITIRPHERGVTPVSPLTDSGVTPMASRGDASVAGGVTPASPEPSLNHPEPAAARGSDHPIQIEQLRLGFAEHEPLDSISFTMDAHRAQRISDLVDLHGVPRLVRAALQTKTGNVRRATAFLDTWAHLRPISMHLVGTEPTCPECGKTLPACAKANSRLNPEDRCEGATG